MGGVEDDAWWRPAYSPATGPFVNRINSSGLEFNAWRTRLLNVAGMSMGFGGFAAIMVSVALLSPPVDRWIMPALTTLLLAGIGMWRSGPLFLRAVALVALAIAIQWFTLVYAGFTPIVVLIALGTVLLSACLLNPIWVAATWVASVALLIPWAIETAANSPASVMFESPVFRPMISYIGFSAMITIGVGAVLNRQRRLLDELDAQRAELSSILENSFDFVVQVDRDRRVASVNRPAEGVTVEELIGRPVIEGVVPADQERVNKVLDEVFATGIPCTHELEVIGFDGERHNLLSRAGPIVLDGKVERLTICWTDVTDQRSLQQQLERSKKLEALGQLTGGVAHDFNNLLTVIQSTLELLNVRELPFQERRRLLSPAMNAVERGSAITGRLLAFARQQALQPIVFLPGRVIAEMVDLLRRSLGESIVVDASADETWYCRIDEAQLQTAVLNLAINARDAMPNGGRLSITTSNHSVRQTNGGGEDGPTPGDYVLMSVADTGTGMPLDVVNRAFDPFFTTKAANSGSGLGLSSVYGFVRQSGGYVDIDSEPDSGTCVNLYLPRTDVTPEPLCPVDEVRGRGELVLLVEDDPSVRDVTESMLNTLGYRTLAAGDAASALDVLEANSDIALLLSDVGLPGPMDGIDLCNDAMARHPELKLLLFSGYVHRPRDLPGKLLKKPFSRSELASAVGELMVREG